MQAMDKYETQAWSLLTSVETGRAFDLNREGPRVRDRFGRNQWGQQCLMARRLVEAGVEIVTTTLDGPLCGRVGNWDDHAVNHHVFDALKFRAPAFDQAVSALIEDLYDRGLDKKVLVVVTGEFGRTPHFLRCQQWWRSGQWCCRDRAAGTRSLAQCQLHGVGGRRNRRRPGDRSNGSSRGRSDRAARRPSRFPGDHLPAPWYRL